ncbi:MAG: hypothetical protein JO011_04785, partial [Ktedonobacteraceae bacterium]|nr:hypothetical protein [Ktedonobacteraceae bacterium]
LRQPFFLLFAVLLLAALILILRAGYYGIAHAIANTPQIKVTESVTRGQAFQLQVTGFTPSEQVQLSWNANGGQFLGMLTADKNGTATNCASSANCIVSLPAPAGTYMLTAIGGTSRSQASTSVIVNVNAVVTPQHVGPGSTIQVTGSGFLAHENLTIYFQDSANGTLPTQADASGSFTQSLLLPATYGHQTSYNIYVENAQQVVRAKVPFSFEVPSITSSVKRARAGKQITISGKGFLANESISLFWNIHNGRHVHASKVKADAVGNFTQTITVPDIFKTVKATLEAIGHTSKLQGATRITLACGSAYDCRSEMSGSN